MKHVFLSAAVLFSVFLVLAGCKCCKKTQHEPQIAVAPIFVPVFVCPCCGAMSRQPAWQPQHPCPVLKHRECPMKGKSKCAVCPVMAPQEKPGPCRTKCAAPAEQQKCPMMKHPCPAAPAQGPGPWISEVIVESETAEIPVAPKPPAEKKAPAAEKK